MIIQISSFFMVSPPKIDLGFSILILFQLENCCAYTDLRRYFPQALFHNLGFFNHNHGFSLSSFNLSFIGCGHFRFKAKGPHHDDP